VTADGAITPGPNEAVVVLQYRRSGLALPFVVIAGGLFFAFVLVTTTSAEIVLSLLAALCLLLGGYSTLWMIRGARSRPGPLVVSGDGLRLILQGEVYVPWTDVLECRVDGRGTLSIDLVSPISRYAISGVFRKHARSKTLVISNSFFDVSGARLDDSIANHIAQ